MRSLDFGSLFSPAHIVLLGTVLLLWAFAAPRAHAQMEDPLDLPETGVSGSVGFMGETYGANGIAGRRPGARSEVFADLSFSLLGLDSGLDVLYSTESNSLRQSMNRISFSWGWTWGRIEAGTVSPSYSQYSLNGATLRGGALQLTPGPFDMAFSAGRSQRAVSPSQSEGFRRAAFERWLYAARLGVGSEQHSHFHLIGTLARDRRSSLDAPGDTRPSENLTLTPDIGVSLFDGRVQLQTEATVSAFTRDTRTQALDLDAPGTDLLTTFYTPRVGSRVDYAGTSRLQVDLTTFQFDASYERVQPGFRSLGLGRVRSDQEVIRLNPRVRLFDRRLSVGVNLQRVRNNLLDQRLSTRRQRQIGANVQARLTRRFTVSGSYMRMVNEHQPASNAPASGSSLGQELERRFVTHAATLSPSVSFQSGSLTHSLSLSGSYQLFDDRPRRPQGQAFDASSNNLTTTASYALTFPSGLSLSLSGNVLRNNTADALTTAFGSNASVGYAFLDRTLQLNLNAGWSENRTRSDTGRDRWMRQLLLNGTASYHLPFGDTVRLMVRGLSNRSLEGRGTSFREGRATLRYSHQF